MELKLKNKAMEQLEGMLLIVLNGIETRIAVHPRIDGHPFNRTKWNFWDAAFPESTFVSLTGSFAFLYCCFYLSFRKCLLMPCYGIKIMEQLRL